MTLHAVCHKGQPGYPWLVFLHGFSGDNQEWQQVGNSLSAFSRLYIDLPGHGGSQHVRADTFAEVSAQLASTLADYAIDDYWLTGYSLGGRLAWYFACQPRVGLRGLVVEGAHPGLLDDTQRQLRRASDAHWAARLRSEPLAEVFADWYQQPVFASLTCGQRQQLIALRCAHNHGATLAAMLEATSLAVQPDLRPAAARFSFPFYYLCGEFDAKFRALAQEIAATPCFIENAGHNAHRENPAQVAACLAQFFAY